MFILVIGTFALHVAFHRDQLAVAAARFRDRGCVANRHLGFVQPHPATMPTLVANVASLALRLRHARSRGLHCFEVRAVVGLVSSRAGDSALSPFVRIGDNSGMDALAAQPGKSARLRRWLARHLVAMIATAIVLTTLGWKSQYQPGAVTRSGIRGVYQEISEGWFGWPRSCVNQYDISMWYGSTQRPSFMSPYSVTSWPSLLLDAVIAAVSLIVTWILFSRTQRRCQHWWQVSLPTVVGFVILAAVVCTVLKSESLWGW